MYSSYTILILSSYSFALTWMSLNSYLDQELRVEKSLLIIWWNIHIGFPSIGLFQHDLTVSMKLVWLAQQFKNMKYQITLSNLVVISTSRGQCSYPTIGKWVTLVCGISSNNFELTRALSRLFHTLNMIPHLLVQVNFCHAKPKLVSP